MCLHCIVKEYTLRKDMTVKKLCHVDRFGDIYTHYFRNSIKVGINKVPESVILVSFYHNTGKYKSGYHCYPNDVSDSGIYKIWNDSVFDKVIKFRIPKGTKIIKGKEKYSNNIGGYYKRIVYVTPILIYNPDNC